MIYVTDQTWSSISETPGARSDLSMGCLSKDAASTLIDIATLALVCVWNIVGTHMTFISNWHNLSPKVDSAENYCPQQVYGFASLLVVSIWMVTVPFTCGIIFTGLRWLID